MSVQDNATADQAKLAEGAVIWGLPLVLAGRYFALARSKNLPLNQFFLNASLASPKLRVAGPNLDTLYGLAWIDLTDGPQVLDVPASPGRYYSIQLHDAWLTTFFYVGTRETGSEAGSYALTPPGWSGKLPDGMREIKAPTNLVQAMTRTQVLHPNDVDAAREIQSAYSLGALSDYPDLRRIAVMQEDALNLFPPLDIAGAGDAFFDELCTLLAAYPPANAADHAALARFAAIGVAPGAKPSQDKNLAPVLAAAVAPAVKRVLEANFFLEKHDGWWVNNKVREYREDDAVMRAAINLWGPAWHLAKEALYFTAHEDAADAQLTGAEKYLLRFPPGKLPPVDAFWSVTMYGDRWSLLENEIDRYAISSTTPGLEFHADGTFDILVQHEPPTAGTSNWLPAPSENFMLFVRVYQPRPELIDGSYILPRPVAVG
jgi:hypothetical protein